MDKHNAGCSSNSIDERSNEEFQNFNDKPADIDDGDSDENVNLSDSYDDLPVSDEDDVQLSSPSNSLNSDVDQRWYAIRGRWGINMMDNNHNNVMDRLVDNHLPEINQPQQQQQDEEETDFLEMDFEPDTNSEIENECLPNGHLQLQSNANLLNFHNHPALPLPQPEFRHTNNLPQPCSSRLTDPPVPVSLKVDFNSSGIKNTGAKPKQLSATNSNRTLKVSKHVSDGDDIFKLVNTRTVINNNIEPSSSLCLPSSIYNSTSKNDEVYNLGASGSRAAHTNLYNDPQSNPHDINNFMKIHKSPSKSSSHHNHKQQRLHEEQNDQFLFEIDPIKPRNSVTIYTTNCDEKVLIDALVR